MRAHIDLPDLDGKVDPAWFYVLGWIWLADRQREVAAVEIWAGDRLVGSETSLRPRPDVAAALGFPPETPTQFYVGCRLQPGDPMEVGVRARLHDGNCTPVLATRKLAERDARTDPLLHLRSSLSPAALGLEIGAHAVPVPGLMPYYTDAVADYTGVAGRADFLADALALPIPDNTLDYLCSSHVLEHLPDPLAAVCEWHRVLRPGGWLYLIVPDQRHTFDVNRATTSAEHILADFRHGATTASSLQHIDDFVFNADWRLLRPDCPPADIEQQRREAAHLYRTQLARGEPIDIHFHTFTPQSLDQIFAAAGLTKGKGREFDLILKAERYPPERLDGICFLLHKAGSGAAPLPSAEEPTAMLQRPGRPRALPLACPVTLEPLVSGPDGEYRSAQSGLRYPTQNGLPVLLPPRGQVPQRQWGSAGARAQRGL